jgi:hypothetical protein
MKSALRRKLDMAVRVREFAKANPAADPRHQAAVTLFGERLATAEALMVRQTEGRLVARAARAKRRLVRQEIIDRYLRHLVTVAERASKVQPDRFGAFRIPKVSTNHVAFLGIVRSMLATAKEGGEELAKYGLGEALVAEFEKAIDELEQAQAAVLEARRTHVGATADLESVIAEISELVGVLNGIYHYRFGGRVELMATWASAKNVVGPFRGKAVPPAPEGGVDQAA